MAGTQRESKWRHSGRLVWPLHCDMQRSHIPLCRNRKIRRVPNLFFHCGHYVKIIAPAGYQNYLHVLNTTTLKWKDLSPVMRGDIPIARQSLSMTVIGDNLYAYGGRSSAGKVPPL